ncbi:hypothetical protein [Paenibacillus sp. WLX2291]|uniref:hypothetical protein n=1 Tax=Paenibacillus sp. WLX2291 TaxID=3296934 RepID=UPI00398408F0
MFRDSNHIWNPTPEDIRRWAYSKEKIPDQDWELAVNEFENIPMICGFVDDPDCKHIQFFLSCLYVFTGDIVSSGDVEQMSRLSDSLNKLESRAKSRQLKDWVIRSKELLLHPDKYDYDYWGLTSKYVY